MKVVKKISLFLILFVLTVSSASALEWKGGADFMFGKKELDKDWNPVDSFQEFGMMFYFTEADLPIGLTMGYVRGSDDGITSSGSFINSVDGQTDEFLLGIRKEFAPPGVDFFKVYLNGGYAAIKWDIETTVSENGVVRGSSENDDWAHGFWVGGGLYFLLAKSAAIGIDFKYSDASSDIDTPFGERTLEAGGTHYSGFIGWRF